jgi:DNA polymerase III delta prime subunit
MLLIAFILCWNAYDIAQLKAAKTALSLDKIAAYDYLLVDHEEEINKLKKAIAKINASCYNE